MNMPTDQLAVFTVPEMPVLTREPAWDEWVAYGSELKQYDGRLDEHVKNFRFVVVEWYDFGVEHWHRPAEKVARDLGYDKETIQNWKWTKNHTASLRASPQGDGLEYEHLRQLAAVKDETAQRELAERVKGEKLSGGALRREIQRANGKEVAPATQDERAQTESGAIETLIQALCDEGVALMEKSDPISRAQADVKLDCAARLRDAAGAR